MRRLRETAHGIARGSGPAVLVSDRLLALERLAGRLANRRAVTRVGDARTGRSRDRAAIVAYLAGDPDDLPARAAAAAAAERHDWAWRERGRRWRLWDGPVTLTAALRDAPDRDAVLRDAGLTGALTTRGFAAAASAGE